MSHQVVLTIISRIKAGEKEALNQLLTGMSATAAHNPIIPFGKLSKTHFARFMVLDESVDLNGSIIAPDLLFMMDCDAPVHQNLQELVTIAGEGLDQIYGHCEDYPCPDGRTNKKRLAYLHSKMVKVNLFYVNTVGRTVLQIQQEAQLRNAIEDFLDQAQHNWSKSDPLEARAAIQSFVKSQPALSWARKPASQPGSIFKLKETLHMIGVPLLLLVSLPIVIPMFLIWLLLLRIHEITYVAPQITPDHAHVQEVENGEDILVQNQFNTVGYIKPGRFWLFTTIVNFWLSNYGTRHIFNKGSLAGLKTVHFGHLMITNEQRRVIFTSYYDGSLESYMDDFIDKVAWVLNIAFSNILGYPRTKWMILNGARDEQGFKNYNRGHQVPTQLWYSAYDHLTAINIEQNAQIRAGLFKAMNKLEAEQWLRLL